FHDAWAAKRLEAGWQFGSQYDEDKKLHPCLKPFNLLGKKDTDRYTSPVYESVKTMIAWGWTLDQDRSRANKDVQKRKRANTISKDTVEGYNPKPTDLRNMTLTREMQNMSERLAENTHDNWAKKKKIELE
ncbi:unnamed protein product, partial [Owenia fusiformis]